MAVSLSYEKDRPKSSLADRMFFQLHLNKNDLSVLSIIEVLLDNQSSSL